MIAHRGILVFVGITFALTCASMLVLAPMATTVFRATIGYVLAVGWEPFAAIWIVRRTVDPLPSLHAYREAPRSCMRLAIALPVLFILGAILVQAALGPVHTATAAPRSSIAGFFAAVALLWVQAIVEELAWRGYLMPRLMEALGPWPGLCVHGILWGACYAPVFLTGASADGATLLGYIITMGLFGFVLGWLRLASGSLAPGAACNATLTLAAGLPLLLGGASPAFGAVFEPAGWLPMLLFVATVVTQPSLRAVVR